MRCDVVETIINALKTQVQWNQWSESGTQQQFIQCNAYKTAAFSKLQDTWA